MSDESTGLEQPKGFLSDANGDKSSKRLWGFILGAAGGVLLMAVGIVAIFQKVADPATSLAAGNALLIAGAGLLGVGVLEGLGQKIGGGK